MERIFFHHKKNWLFFLPAVYLLFTFLNIQTLKVPATEQIWKGYYTLLADDSFPRGRVESFLDSLDMEYLSLTRETVAFFDYTGMNTVPLVDLELYLDRLDPRRDKYMTLLANYYHVEHPDGGWNVFYIRSDLPAGRFGRRLEDRLDGADFQWILADQREPAKQNSALVFILFSAGVFFCSGKSRWRVPFALIPWAGVFFQGDSTLVLTAGAMSLSLIFLKSQGLELWKQHLNYPLGDARAEGKLKSAGFVLALSFLFSLIWILPGENTLLQILFLLTGAAGQTAAALFEFQLESRRFQKREHRLFYPVFILEPPRRFTAGGSYLLPLVPALFLSAVLFIPETSVKSSSPAVPAPVSYEQTLTDETAGRGEFSWEALQLLNHSRPGTEYPDFSDYITHRAYQDSFFFGGSYDFPSPGGRLLQSRFFIGEKGPTEELIISKEFTEEWYGDIIGSVPEGTIAGLLLTQVRPGFTTLSDNSLIKPETGWRAGGYIFFAVYFTAFLFVIFIKGKKKPQYLNREIQPLTYSSEIEKENIA